MSDQQRFDGWAQIEAYLNLTSKTVLLHGYPVRRMLGRVFALRHELDAHRDMLEQSARIVTQPAQHQPSV